MTPEQKKRAHALIAGWRKVFWRDAGNDMSALLQELIDAPEQAGVPFGYLCEWQQPEGMQNTQVVYYGGPGSATEDDWVRIPDVHRNLPLYAAPQAPAVQADMRDAELPAGFILVQKNPSKAVCLDGGRFHGWLMWKHPDGQWVSECKLKSWEIMQAEDQQHYGIVIDAAMQAQKGGDL